MPWVSFHTFRHTCASLLFANGKDIKQIQTWLGHADAAFTLRTYVHLLEEGVGSADFLDDAVEIDREPWSGVRRKREALGTARPAQMIGHPQ
jgi:Phage integrase family